MRKATSTKTKVCIASLLLLHYLQSSESFATNPPIRRSLHSSIATTPTASSSLASSLAQQHPSSDDLYSFDYPISNSDDSTSRSQRNNTNWLSKLDLRRYYEVLPSMEFPSRQIRDTHEAYLKSHQIVKKRRVVKRVLEISSILGGQVLGPFVRSLVKTKPDFNNIHIPTDDDWDAFWRETRKGKTNAQRVAEGIPALGPTFVKMAQILASRPDLLNVPLAEALGGLQDNMPSFDNLTAKRMIRTDMKTVLRRYAAADVKAAADSADTGGAGKKETMDHPRYIQTTDDLKTFMDSLSKEPVAAASVGQVYKGGLPGYGPVAVKVLRPGIKLKVERDATLFHSVATWLESWNNNTLKLPFVTFVNNQQKSPLGSIQLVQAVDEFTSRVLEDMDFKREAENMKVFADMYDSRRGRSATVKVAVPDVIPELCSSRVLVMEWMEGTKLTDICVDCDTRPQEVEENLKLIVQAIECTISQFIDHGLLHGDPHSANLLKVTRDGGKPELGYLDFGLVSYVPQKFRDGIVCAVVQLVFARNTEAVADLCGDLGLLPPETLQDAGERKRFLDGLENVMDQILIWPKDQEGLSTAVPKLRFEKLLPAVSQLIRSFKFTVPPYGLNNVRALATLEGMALKLDPDFNVLRVIYPYSINRLMRNPSVSKKVQETFVEICRSPTTKLISPKRVRMLLNDWSLWTGYRKRRVLWDLVTSAGGRRVTPVIIHNWYLNRLRNLRMCAAYTKHAITKTSQRILHVLHLSNERQNAVY